MPSTRHRAAYENEASERANHRSYCANQPCLAGAITWPERRAAGGRLPPWQSNGGTLQSDRAGTITAWAPANDAGMASFSGTAEGVCMPATIRVFTYLNLMSKLMEERRIRDVADPPKNNPIQSKVLQE